MTNIDQATAKFGRCGSSVARHLVHLGHFGADFVELWSMWVKLRPTWAKFAPTSRLLDRDIGCTLGHKRGAHQSFPDHQTAPRHVRILLKSGRNRSTLVRSGHDLSAFGQHYTQSSPTPADFGETWARFGRTRPKLVSKRRSIGRGGHERRVRDTRTALVRSVGTWGARGRRVSCAISKRM